MAALSPWSAPAATISPATALAAPASTPAAIAALEPAACQTVRLSDI
jgi:hypothetical protein